LQESNYGSSDITTKSMFGKYLLSKLEFDYSVITSTAINS